MSTRPRSPSRSTTAPDPDVDTSDVVHRRTELLTSIDTHLAALVDLATKQRLGSPHLTIAEAAVYLGISVDNLRRKMRAGKIPHHKRPGSRPYLLRHEINQWLADPATLCGAGCADEQEDTPNGHEKNGGINRRQLEGLLRGAKPPSDPGPNES